MLSRRTFLAGVGAPALASRRDSRLREFSYSQVRLTGGPLAVMYERTRAHFVTLDEDRLLKVYRQRAAMPAPGRDMGGWYDADGFVPGHLLGQFISGLARIHAHTGDAEAAAKAARLVTGYGAAFERDGNPYASQKAIDTWACYVLDKYAIGLIDAATLAGVSQARPLLTRVLEAGRRYIPDHVFDRVGVRNPPYDEPYVLPENLFNAWTATGDARFRGLAERYLLDSFFDPLARGENVLPGRHGYSHVIALSSAAKAFEVTGRQKYLRAIRNGWDMLADTQQYASGAWAPQEMFVQPHAGQLAASLTATRDHFETPCCYYAHSKLARYLTAFTGEARYADGLERVLYNTILGALDPDDDGGYFYYSDYQAGARKRYYPRKWPCCAGTLLQSVADYPLNIYFHSPRGVAICLYAASEVRWTTKGVAVRLAQHTAYPESDRIEVRVDPAAPVEFELRLRIPQWLDRPARLAVNGRTMSVDMTPGRFATLQRRWRKGDVVELTLPFSFRAAPIDDRNPNTVALMYGPLMLVAVEPPAHLASTLRRIEPVPGTPLEFDCDVAGGQVRLRPFYRVGRESYSTYFTRES
ncbi:MAG: glycoside hydrolase family 127 protein [Acidobacteria bacterium]|nr:glycoside hydrolase family 127 protein [Acidobacteriota bacterium]